MTKKLNYGRTFLIGLAFMSISSFWVVYDNIIPLILMNTFGLGETVTGVVMAADNVLALFLLPMSFKRCAQRQQYKRNCYNARLRTGGVLEICEYNNIGFCQGAE